jgi:hypothetical protein
MKDDWKQVFPFESSAVTAINILLEPDATKPEDPVIDPLLIDYV